MMTSRVLAIASLIVSLIALAVSLREKRHTIQATESVSPEQFRRVQEQAVNLFHVFQSNNSDINLLRRRVDNLERTK